MHILPFDASDEAILAVVRQWADALARQDYEGSASLLTSNGNERDWPASLVEEVITSYHPAAEPPATQRTEVTRWSRPRARPDVVGTIEYDLVVDGVLSDLTAIFWVRRLPDGLALELYDIHIL